MVILSSKFKVTNLVYLKSNVAYRSLNKSNETSRELASVPQLTSEPSFSLK